MEIFLLLGLLLAHLVFLLDCLFESVQVSLAWCPVLNDIAPQVAALLRLLWNGNSLVNHLQALWQFGDHAASIEMARVRWIEASLFAHEEVALGLLVVDGDALLASNDISIFDINSKEVLKLTFTVELSGSILPDKEETWFRDCLWWR